MKKHSRLLWLILCLPLLFSCTPQEQESTEEFRMTATVTAIGEKIEVNVIEGSYGASGPYWVITGSGTAYRDKNGTKKNRGDIAVGDTVTIVYSGQVMMSFPPQIVAKEVIIH